MVRQTHKTSPAWQCPHCMFSQLWQGNSDQVLVSCSNCRGISLLDTREDKPDRVDINPGEKNRFAIKRDFPTVIIEAIVEEENQ